MDFTKQYGLVILVIKGRLTEWSPKLYVNVV